MIQVININYHGRIIPIEVPAYDQLKKYTERLQTYFENEEGKEEIINDIENRISELFQNQLSKGSTCITEKDVHAVISSMGNPEDFDAQPIQGQQQQHKFENYYSSNETRRLYRDENNKFIGGVCSGLANYFQIDKVIVRIVFLILFFSFGVGLIPYLILWMAVPSSASSQIGAMRKKLYRDPDGKLLAGVCSGLAHYFTVNVWIPRVLFLLPLLSLKFEWDIFHFNISPGSVIIYIILWLVMPEATTTSEKLEMKGEKIDLQSIQKSIHGELKGVKERAQKLGTEAGEKFKDLKAESSGTLMKILERVLKIIVLLIKSFVYTILTIVGLALVISLFALGVLAFAFFPLKNYLLSGIWQDVFAWGALTCLFVIPIIGILTWIIRKIAGIKKQRTIIRASFIGFFVVGLVSLFALFSNLSNNFSYYSKSEEKFISLDYPTAQKLDLNFNNHYLFPEKNIDYRKFLNLIQDSLYLGNVSLQCVKSPSDSFMISIQKCASGSTVAEANHTRDGIRYSIHQKDSTLDLNKYFLITQNEKFRNQRVVIKIYVPKGKKVKFNGDGLNSENFIFVSPFSIKLENHFYNEHFKNWKENNEYIMDEDGFHSVDELDDKTDVLIDRKEI